jgi:choline kinase
MAELAMNMTSDISVIIPTAGLGSRMDNYTKNLNKALLPYKDKPTIAHIIDQFPKDTNFIIPTGFLAQQVKDFCAVAYADRNITFVDVDWTSDKAGTGYTLLQCKDFINGRFWYVPCDTYFNETITSKVTNFNCYFAKHVAEKDTSLYTMFNVNSGTINDITFKLTQPESWLAFTGLMYIHDWEYFFNDLEQLESNEFIGVIKPGDRCVELNSWLDFGNPKAYRTAVAKDQKFDFSKKDEVTYICNNRVVKWWLDVTVAEKKFRKTLSNPLVFPANCMYSGNYMAYDFFPGQTLYEFNNPVVFKELLKWLEASVWHSTDQDVTNAAVDFYKNKSLNRINKFLEKYPQLPVVTHINGVEVKDYQYYIDNLDWDYLSKNVLPGFLHGDLQFDNLIISPTGEFKLIDWRHEFSNLVSVGDIYYDLAKMSGGFIINYANIKEHNFDIEIQGSKVTLSTPSIDSIDVYQNTLKQFIINKGWDYKKVQQLIPIIFWNMSPLHTAPFDIFLWYIGIKLFEDLENEN